ncbi:MAG TPA: hypothetical protein VFS96_01725, partial [Nitrolancea sp.]|nr:hypothetical protein [Nitrolancea sp.]
MAAAIVAVLLQQVVVQVALMVAEAAVEVVVRVPPVPRVMVEVAAVTERGWAVPPAVPSRPTSAPRHALPVSRMAAEVVASRLPVRCW